MTLTAKDVAEIARLLEESDFDELYLELEGLKLSLRRGSAANVQPAGNGAAPREPQSGAPAQGRPASEAAAARGAPGTTPIADGDPNTVDISAPLLGTFYRAPKPGAPLFVEVGSRVEPDTIIGIIEVMKLMNTVRAGVQGNVAQILAQDGALVEYGQTLMRVSKTN